MGVVNRRAARAAVVAALGIAALGMSAATASAKVGYDLKASPHTVKAGARVHVRGYAMNDDYFFQRFCVQERQGTASWHTVKCAHGAASDGGSVDTWFRASHRGTLQFRGALYEAEGNTGRLRLQTVTPTQTVRVR